MALTGILIFKLLPKTNCKKCGQPTCLAFAMKLAQRQASIDACPDASEEAKQTIGESSAPPIRPISFGVGENAIKLGEEIVIFRHEKKFVNPCAFAVQIDDTLSDNEISKIVDDVLKSEIDRVGQRLKIDAIFLNNLSCGKEKFEQGIEIIENMAPKIPLILATRDAQIAESALKLITENCSIKRPIVYGVNESNAEAMASLAKDYNIPLGVVAQNLEKLSSLTERLKFLGVEDLIIDSGAKTAKEILKDNTYIRRLAIKKNFKPLGYPTINFANRENQLVETAIASLCVMKYASIVVISSIEKWKNLALFTLRQNIYTDPQVPMQVEQKIYKIGDPDINSPLLVTTNFSLTYFIVSGEIENSKIPARLAIIDCEGLSVLTAWAAGKFTASKIAQFIQESEIEKELQNKELILPGCVAILSGVIEEKLLGWKITVGPREASGLTAFLKQFKTK